MSLEEQVAEITQFLVEEMGFAPSASSADRPLWPDKCRLDFNASKIRHDRHPEMVVTIESRGDGYYVAPVATDQFDNGVIVTLEPKWSLGGVGVTIAEADDDGGPNTHLRWRQVVCCQDGDGPIMRDGGTGAPDEKQEPVDGAFARLKRYNETRGQVCPVRIVGGHKRKLWIEMHAPSGVVTSDVIYLAPVQGQTLKAEAL